MASLMWGSEEKEMQERPEFSRSDLGKLKKLERKEVFEALGSFDDAGLSDEEFVLRTVDLLDAARVPGLAEARAAGDTKRVLAVVVAACRGGRTAPGSRPDIPPSMRKTADDALSNRFTFYDEPHRLPESIDWDANPGTAHWGHDLNRFSYLNPLVRAYHATGDERYSRKVVTLILDWIGKCDPAQCFRGTPYMFGSYLNNATHCAVWSSCVDSLFVCGQVEPMELLRILKSLHDQLAYLEIVTNGHSGNWPTIGCRGMLAALQTFPVFRDTDRLADYCASTLAAQIDDQVLPDGVQFELTPHYHQCVVNNLLSSLRSFRALGRDLEPRTMVALRRMIRYTQQTVVPDGSAHVAFNDGDPAAVPSLERALDGVGLDYLLLPDAELGPRCFPHAGVAFLRQRACDGDLYLAFDAGPYGAGHQHEDKLGFWLFAYGRSLLVDPGRHLYDWSAVSFYDYLRSTTAHSTVKVDGKCQHSAGRRETWIAREPLVLEWVAEAGDVRAAGAYDLGYGEDNALDVTHRREIVFVRERFWVIFDRVGGEGEHQVESRFQFAPGELAVDGTRAHTCFADANLLLVAAATAPFGDIHVECGRNEPRGGWYSERYGRIEPAPALSLSTRSELPLRMAVLLFPYKGEVVPDIGFRFDGTTAQIAIGDEPPIAVTAR
ncbi:alginate lyase family protein [Verrucomicrobiota bacterium]